ncbi:asparagine synthase-related protein [Amycolatopsis ruanii]|uniref:asparagine synthase-related protein n=1 Tax=Amycolatopsis ruanii TaxID=944491 RepID=UPI001F073F29|nr:asparagine synthase-related protein [Amycolatopsis ruanii]
MTSRPSSAGSAMPSSSTEAPPRLSTLDIAAGQPLGAAPFPLGVPTDPVRALRTALRPALRREPCVIAFSGGRDSSVLLAVAADLAAREGLAPPIALTFRYPGDAAADESAWQEVVIRHVGVDSWVRRDIAGELDLIGPLVRPVLRARGPVYPAALGNTMLLASHAPGGSLVTGNAGDEVLGGHRLGTLRAVARRRGRGVTGADWARFAVSAAPAFARRRIARRSLPMPWLRPDPRRVVWRAAADRPLRWETSVRTALATRAFAVGFRTRADAAAEYGCELVEPFADPSFVASYAATRPMTRAAGTRLVADGVLPEAVLARRDKARFNASRFGACSREFARDWGGTGVDESLVDPDALRAAQLADEPPAATAMLLQQAWLAEAT